MKNLALFLFALISNLVWSQPTITNAEDFAIGTTLKFQKCDPLNVSPGNAGPNQTWDYSNITTLPDTSIEWMLSPSSTTNGSLFPTANLVVKVSNGQFTYITKTENENNIVGFIDTSASFPPTYYTNPMVIAKRPITYGTIITDTFTLSGSQDLGTVTIEPDAYGTLILPNGTYSNVLRTKISQIHPWFSYTLYAWFDGISNSAIMKMDDLQNVEYLLSEEISVGISETNPKRDFNFYPNPSSNSFLFETERPGELVVTNNLGQVVRKSLITTTQTTISTTDLANGIYHLVFLSGNTRRTSPLIIQH